MNKKITCISVALIAFGVFVGHAAADHALLDLLVRKGILTGAEASIIENELEAKVPLKVEAKGKETVELRFNGRLQGQYDTLSLEENGEEKPAANHFYFRRLRVGAKAKLENGIYGETVFDLAGNEYSTNKAFVGYKFNDGFDLKLGYDKVPFGFEETSSSAKIQTIERSVVNRFFADDVKFSGKHMGLHTKGEFDRGLSYAASLVNAPQGEDSKLLGESNSSNDMAVFGRLQWEGDGLTVGFDGGVQPNNNEIDDNNVTAFTGYVNYRMSGLNVLGEYFTGDLDKMENADGYALRISGKFDKFEPVFRYAHLRVDKFEIDGDELIRRAPKGGTVKADHSEEAEIDSLYFGANYHYSPSVKFMFGYEIAEAEISGKLNGDDPDNDEFEISGFRARMQVLW